LKLTRNFYDTTSSSIVMDAILESNFNGLAD
jgi:hypothetical protein